MIPTLLSECDIPKGTKYFELEGVPLSTRVDLVRDGAVKQFLRDSPKLYDDGMSGNGPALWMAEGIELRYVGITIRCADKRAKGCEFTWQSYGKLLVATLSKGILPAGVTLKVNYSRVFDLTLRE